MKELFILTLTIALAACGKNDNVNQHPTGKNQASLNHEEVQQEWTKRNTSQLDLENHKSKGF